MTRYEINTKNLKKWFSYGFKLTLLAGGFIVAPLMLLGKVLLSFEIGEGVILAIPNLSQLTFLSVVFFLYSLIISGYFAASVVKYKGWFSAPAPNKMERVIKYSLISFIMGLIDYIAMMGLTFLAGIYGVNTAFTWASIHGLITLAVLIMFNGFGADVAVGVIDSQSKKKV